MKDEGNNSQYYFEQVKKLLERNNYVITVRAHDNGCILSIPKTVDLEVRNEIQIEFSFNEEKGGVDLVTNYDNKKQSMFFTCPPYVRTLLIMCVIMNICIINGYGYEFIDFYIDDKKYNTGEFFANIYDKNLDEEEFKKQEDMSRILSKCIVYDFTPEDEQIAKNKNVIEGYHMLKTIINSQTGIGNFTSEK